MPTAHDTPDPRPGRTLLFLGGVHRSGTTLLAHCLGEHPDVSAFADTGVPADEGQHLQAVYPPAKEFGGPGRFAFDPAARLDEGSPLVSPESRGRLLREWGAHWNLSRSVLLEKSPPNLLRLRFLQALFPDAAFVVILRHPVPVAYATGKWRRRDSLRSLLRHWVVAHEIYRGDAPHVRRLLEVRFEELVAEPDAVVARVEQHVGLEPRPSSVEVRADANDRYLERYRQEERTLRGRVSHALARRELEGRVQAFGYSLRV